jgi:phosphoserine phosphatase SerB
MIAGKRSQLLGLEFREDYGVDIGILIDMYLMNVRVKEVEIGYLENKSKPWQALGKMSKEVAHAIIVKASGTKNPKINFEELAVMKEIRSQMEFALDDSLLSLNKAIAFDMDNTLLKKRFIDVCADKFGFREELMNIRSAENDSIVRSKRIAILLKGIALRDLIDTAESIPVTDDAPQVIAELKARGYLVGIISDSYDCICNHIKNKLGMDFSLSNELEFSQSICTGEVRIPSFFFNSSGSVCKHPVCKTNALIKITNRYKIPMENCLAIGDSINDLCMIRTAGLGISFCTSDELLKHYADIVISTPSFASILDHAR